MLASIVHRPGVGYPEPDEFFSPSEPYAEYRHGHVARKPNAVYAMVREAFAQANLDHAHYGTAAWNPLGQLIAPGSRVFLLCNFVQHRRRTESAKDFLGKCTHGSVLRALIDYVLIAVGEHGRVTFGNAPLQSCDFNRVLRETGAATVVNFFDQHRCPVAAKDLRLLVAERALSGRTTRIRLSAPTDGITVALDDSSFLQPLCRSSCNDAPAFRVADYDSAIMASWHNQQKHRYLIHQDILQADVICSVPKLKTHEKVGITCALKGYVGIVGRKECLPHHRLGSPRQGGDEFPDGNPLLAFSSHLSEWVCRRGQQKPLVALAQIADHTLRRALRKAGYITAGAWDRNDTAWRMALDLARVAHYADMSGQMRNNLHRPNFAVIDGIVGGEGEGPLAPTAVPSGGIIFSDNVVLADWLAAQLMGYEPLDIPYLQEAKNSEKWPLSVGIFGHQELITNGKELRIEDVAPLLGRSFRAPKGWRSRLMQRRENSSLPSQIASRKPF